MASPIYRATSASSAAIAMTTVLAVVALLIEHHQLASANLDQDKAECANQLVGLATCLPYVGGSAKAPTVDCCTGLKQVLQKSQKCLCILIKDRDDPNLGLKINGTLAATLPSACHAPADVSDCINLLHLPPNSTDAKIFKEFANITQGSGNSTSPSAAASANSTASKDGTSGANGRWTSGWHSNLSIIVGFLLWAFTCFIF